MLQVIWVALGIVIFVAAVRSRNSTRAMYVGRAALATLYIGAGALVNAVFLATGSDYAEFAATSYIPFVRDTWRSLVVPNVSIFIPLLIGFETAVGALVLRGGRFTQIGLVAAIAFHAALLPFGWGSYMWSIPMIVALALLLRSERRAHTSGAPVPEEPHGLHRLRTPL